MFSWCEWVIRRTELENSLGKIAIDFRDQYQYLGNCPPTPPLTQQQSIDNNLRLMLGQGRGRWAVAQILILIRFLFARLGLWGWSENH